MKSIREPYIYINDEASWPDGLQCAFTERHGSFLQLIVKVIIENNAVFPQSRLCIVMDDLREHAGFNESTICNDVGVGPFWKKGKATRCNALRLFGHYLICSAADRHAHIRQPQIHRAADLDLPRFGALRFALQEQQDEPGAASVWNGDFFAVF